MNEMVAPLARWEDQAKLLNLTTRLKESAYFFYHACTPKQQASFSLLVKELSKRFIPVRTEAIQSGNAARRRARQLMIMLKTSGVSTRRHTCMPEHRMETQQLKRWGSLSFSTNSSLDY